MSRRDLYDILGPAVVSMFAFAVSSRTHPAICCVEVPCLNYLIVSKTFPELARKSVVTL
jgi:hypothetical protein